MHRTVDVHQAVLREHDDATASLPKPFDQASTDRIHVPERLSAPGIVDAVSLEVVVKMRQVGQKERRREPLVNGLGGVGNPLARGQSRLWPPEVEERKRAQLRG